MMESDTTYTIIPELIGHTFTSVVKIGTEELIFTREDGHVFRFYHSQDCCESVYIEDVVGDLDDLVGMPLMMAEVATKEQEETNPEWDSTSMWTFYKFGTIKGYVTVRWYGSSNGYYSVAVDFEEQQRLRL